MAFGLTKDSSLTVKTPCTRKAAIKIELKPNKAQLSPIRRGWHIHERLPGPLSICRFAVYGAYGFGNGNVALHRRCILHTSAWNCKAFQGKANSLFTMPRKPPMESTT